GLGGIEWGMRPVLGSTDRAVKRRVRRGPGGSGQPAGCIGARQALKAGRSGDTVLRPECGQRSRRAGLQGGYAVLNLRAFLLDEKVAVVKLKDTYDIFDPDSGQQVGVAHEEIPGFVQFLKLFISKKLMPTSVAVYEGMREREIFRIRRGVAFLRTK